MIEKAPVGAIVTGAASGIGRAVTERLIRQGVDVLAVDKDSVGLATLPEGIRSVCVDLTTSDGRDEVISLGGGARYLVNSAGILKVKDIFDVEVSDLVEVFMTNFFSAWELISKIGRGMPRGGAIVNLSSSSAKLATTTEVAGYASSKAALLSITRSFSYALAPYGIRINAVCPGVVDTPMQEKVTRGLAEIRGISSKDIEIGRLSNIPLGRAATADECARVICFLLSEEACYMTGQSLNVTGGLVNW